ncbi:DUF167 family protein [Sediminibacterium sp.]|uniref:DUF167 domain-containing protein n=1 Tax=Sediminibacterium sp. TaxID=1917865 RepID=UPI002736D159|nr:DUF167 family protein [Sediminibacterium sp.]MDP3394097.1 DUF167 family protein [Sediminibacterium sp.]MDP3566314.1 DUF167 family protein [Sediminibacterium sp.]
MTEPFYSWDNDVLNLNVLVSAGARTNLWGKVKGNQIKISIMTAPEKGKATAFLIDFLAKSFNVSKKSVELVAGEFIPHKQFRIHQPKQLPTIIKPNNT